MQNINRPVNYQLLSHVATDVIRKKITIRIVWF